VQYVLPGAFLILAVGLVVIAGLGEIGLAAMYGRAWGWLSERRARR
jgi:hypothetical protein